MWGTKRPRRRAAPGARSRFAPIFLPPTPPTHTLTAANHPFHPRLHRQSPSPSQPPGDVHVEPDHGCVVSTDFGTLERLAKDAAFGLKHYATYKCGSSACAHGACNGNGAAKAARKAAAGKAAGGKGAWPKAAYERWCPEAAKPEA